MSDPKFKRVGWVVGKVACRRAGKVTYVCNAALIRRTQLLARAAYHAAYPEANCGGFRDEYRLRAVFMERPADLKKGARHGK